MSIHSWAMEYVEGKLGGIIQDLYTIEDGVQNYPTIQEIKDVIEKALDITPQEKCKRLQKLRIQKGESIRNFNWRYKKMYNNLPKFYQTFITVEDYEESIIYRPYARSQVITQRCLDLEDAFEEAELAERAEERRNNNNEVIMTTLYNNHPFYYNNNNYTVNPYRQTKTINYNSTFNGRQSYIKKNNFNQRYYKGNADFQNNYNRIHFNNDKVNNYTNNNPITRKESNFSNNNNINETKSTYNNQKTCYRCGQKGHYYNHCLYSFKQLAEMEEKNNNESLKF